MTEVKCETCRWWRRHESIAVPSDPSRWGNCHYHAPQPAFGLTQEDHFCRHHEAARPHAAAAQGVVESPFYIGAKVKAAGGNGEPLGEVRGVLTRRAGLMVVAVEIASGPASGTLHVFDPQYLVLDTAEG